MFKEDYFSMSKQNYIRASIIIIIAFFAYMIYYSQYVLPREKYKEDNVEYTEGNKVHDFMTRGLFLDI